MVNRSLSDWNKLVLNVREVVVEVNAFDLWDNISGDFDLGPSVDFNSHVFLDDVGMSVSDGNVGCLFDNIELTILGDQDGATMLITDNASMQNSNFVNQQQYTMKSIPGVDLQSSVEPGTATQMRGL